MNIQNILRENESEHLDFKKEYHSNNVKLLHDILCLVNSYHDGDRFLVFGVNDDKTICGIENDPNRKTSSNINDMLRASNLNRIPNISITSFDIQNHTVDLLTIKNRPDKPFYLSRNKEEQGVKLRNGVVYTRIGDTNTPVNETATESEIELMWRERFGFDLTPMELFKRLLDEPENWVKVDQDNYMYHKIRPEFVIRDGEILTTNFVEPWMESFPDQCAASFEVCIYYLSTILQKETFVHCDGYRYRIPLPELVAGGKYEIKENSIGWKISQIFTQYYPIPSILPSRLIEIT